MLFSTKLHINGLEILSQCNGGMTYGLTKLSQLLWPVFANAITKAVEMRPGWILLGYSSGESLKIRKKAIIQLQQSLRTL